jgi:nucleotide-binding universal stress UspA family protein
MARTVLVPTDFRPGSEPQLAWAADLVAATGGSLRVLHVVPRAHQLSPFFRAGLLPRQTVELIRRRAAAHLARLLRRHRVRYELEVVEGDPAACILDAIERRKPSLVVIGTHTRRALPRFLLGSVARRIVHAARVPVVTIPGPSAR